jgi:hypothetical protein
MKVIFPYFESGLPLRSRDLNAIYRRADEDVRNTRTCLQGMGIFYGLKVTMLNGGFIKVSSGAGVTSQGYMFCSLSDMKLGMFKKGASIPIDSFGTKPFTDILNKTTSGTTVTTVSPRISVDELEYKEIPPQGDVVGLTPFTTDDIKGKRLIIFFKLDTETLSGCANCEKGTKANVVTEFLLIDDTQWRLLTFNCLTDSGSGTAAYEPDKLSLPRFALFDNCLTFNQIGSIDALNSAYAVSTKSNIQTEVKRLIDHYSRLFNDDTEGSKKAVDAIAAIATNSQYHHDYWRLIVRAYNEFVSTAFAQSFAGLPPEGCFPKHLCLGRFNEIGVFETENTRTKLYRPPFDDATDADFATAQTLYYRLMAVVKNHRLGNLPNAEVRITPSRRATYPLSKQAIPFYLNSTALVLTWQPDNPFTTAILSYDDTKRLQHQPYFDEADFYRIEGHVGMSFFDVKDALIGNNDNTTGLRGCLNLPFEVVFVTLQDNQRNDFMTLSRFSFDNNGLEHQGGVPAGGTFVVVMDTMSDERQLVVADFCLPYWWRKPFVKVVADFTVIQDGNTFTFDATPSQNANILVWSVNGAQFKSADYQIDRLYQPKLDVSANENTKHYFIKLEAFSEDGQKDVEITTVVIQRQVTIPDQVVAVIKITSRQPLDNGETISFDSVDSKFAQEFEWFIDDDSRSKTTKMSADFIFDNETQTSKSFLVKLLARNTTTKREDVEEITITIERQLKQEQEAIPEPIFAIVDRTNIVNDAGIVGQKVSFVNKSVNAASYIWQPFEADGIKAAGIAVPKNSLETFTQDFLFDNMVQTSKTYVMRLTAIRGALSKSAQQNVTIQRQPVIVRLTDVPPTPDVNVRGLLTEEEPPSVVEPAAALKELRTRQRDYKTALEMAAVAEPNAQTDDKIYSALTFISGFQHDATKLEEQLARWQQVIEAALPTRNTSKVNASQHAIVQNLVCFLFDKLSDLQASGISEKVRADVTAVMETLKSYKNLNIKALKEAWQVDNIRTAENSATIDVLLSLF